jgi:uncharacterized membrane protein
VQRTQVTTHSGPLPAPEILSGYELILPGAAERILRMAEKQQESRNTLELRQLEADIEHRNDMVQVQRNVHRGAFISDYVGQTMGFIVALASLAGAAYAGIVKGNAVVAGLFLSLPVAGMIQAVRGMKSRDKQEK